MGDDRDRSRSPRDAERHEKRDRRERDRERDRDREHRKGGERERDRERDHDRRDRDRDRDRHRDHDRHRERDRDRRETSEERRERRRERREREERREEKRERRAAREKRREGVKVVDDDDAGMWVEKDIDAVSALGTIPTADSLPLKSTAVPDGQASPPPRATEDQPARDDWMLPPEERGGGDFFSSLGTAVARKDELKPEPKVQHSKYELNTQYLEGKNVDDYKTEEKQKTAPGGPGYQWRMMKLRRAYEQAEEQGRAVEEVALERYGSLEEFNDALAERRFLDDKEARRRSRGPARGSDSPSTGGARTPDNRRFMFAHPGSDDSRDSRPASRQGFRRPGEEPGRDRDRERERERDSTPGAGRIDALKRQAQDRSSPLKGATPIPSVFTPQALTRGTSSENKPGGPSGDVYTLEQLNRLQAKVLRAKLSDDPAAEDLEAEYERERARFDDAGGVPHTTGNIVREDEDGNTVQVEVLPTLDGQGRLYDVGLGKEDAQPAGKRKKDPKFESRDRLGNLIRYNADDDDVTLGELVRQEKFGGGAGDMKNLDAELAAQISRDGRFQSDLEYLDDNSERLARKRMKTDAMKRAFAINDYKRTKKALDECPFCYQDDRQPLTAIVALGKRAYLCCTLTEELVPGHCLIVPLQHCLSSLEMDDDDWDEVKNFMKCLMQMFAAENKGVLFYETILSFRQQRHTYIECVPLPADQFADAPGYFRESILASESEWSQHKKLIDFSTRPGGFRRMLVPNMPYFMVQWDYRGEKGYGHVIEGIEDMKDDDEDGGGMHEGDKGAAKFPPYFAGEIIGNMLDLEPRLWRRPKHIDYSLNKERARALGTKFQPYNWTVM